MSAARSSNAATIWAELGRTIRSLSGMPRRKAKPQGVYAATVAELAARAVHLRAWPRVGLDWTAIGAVIRERDTSAAVAATLALARAVAAGGDPAAALESWRAVVWCDLAAPAEVTNWNRTGAELAKVDPARFVRLLDIASRIVAGDPDPGAARVGAWREIGARLAELDPVRFGKLLAAADDFVMAYRGNPVPPPPIATPVLAPPPRARRGRTPPRLDAPGPVVWATAEAATVGALALRAGCATFAGWGFTRKVTA